MKRTPFLILVAAVTAACNGSGGSGQDSADTATTPPTATGDTDPTGDADTTGDTDTIGDTDTTGDSTGCDPTCFDVGTDLDAGPGCGGDSLAFSYIWISNSGGGTVSKIDTQTKLEVARYVTGPGGAQNPSRTSVGLDGDVAVVNRQGGISKVVARVEDCDDRNNDGMIQTSSGANDVLAWWADECVVWNTSLPSASRPAAWTAGEEIGTDECGDPILGNAKIWTSAPNGADAAWVYLVDGATGNLDETINITAPSVGTPFGIYGGAVDADNDFWGITHAVGPLVHVPFADPNGWEVIAIPADGGEYDGAYGITVDAKGRVWVGGWDGDIHRYEPEIDTWTTVDTPMTYGATLTRGMMVDADGQLWAAAKSKGGDPLAPDRGIAHIDTDTATWVEIIDGNTLIGVSEPAGVSIDFDGLVWMVDTTANGAWVYDPVMQTTDFVGGLTGPYTYSDMTGWALINATNPVG